MLHTGITLIKKTKAANAYGDLVETATSRTVYAQVKSVGQTEYYQAMATGLRPEIKFVLTNWLDYQDEETVVYTPFSQSTAITYKVIRTYRDGEAIELTCQRGVDLPGGE